MKKFPKGEVVLSSGQIQAARLNQLEYQRLERQVSSLQEDLRGQLARIEREQQGLRSHFQNVVQVIKPNRAFQLWKQANGQKEEKKSLGQQRSRKQTMEPPDQPLRPLLLLLDDPSKKPVEPIFSFLRLNSSPINKHSSTLQRVNILDNSPPPISQPPPSTSHRVNPLLTMLNGRPASSNIYQQIKSPAYGSTSSLSLSPIGTTSSSRKLIQGQFVTSHRKADLDALYRMALQNQTAYKSVDYTRIEDRKLHDKEFAARHRALKGSMRSASVMN